MPSVKGALHPWVRGVIAKKDPSALDHRLPPPPTSALVERLSTAFGWLEARGQMVKDIYLSPSQPGVLGLFSNQEAFDFEVNEEVLINLSQQKDAAFIGYFRGAYLYFSRRILVDHVILVPDGLDAKLVDDRMGVPF